MTFFKSPLASLFSIVLIAATLVAAPAPAHAVTPGDATCDLSGSGAQGDPYLVSDRTDLEEIIDCADDTTLTYYKQEAIIDLSTSVWTPLIDQDPAGSTGLKISYDGDNWAIVGMKAEGSWMASLFGHLAAGSEVENLALLGNSVGYVKTTPSSGDFIPAKHLAGVVAALSTGGLTITNVQIEGFTRISGASVGALVGRVVGGTTAISNAWVQMLGNDPNWANDRGWISAMNSKYYASNAAAPSISFSDISAAGGLVGMVTGSGVDVTISSSFVNTTIGVGGADAEPTRYRYAPATIGGIVGLFDQGNLTIHTSSYSGNLLGTLRDASSQNANLMGVAPIVGYAYSTSAKGGLTMNVSKFRIASELSGDGFVSGLFGSYRTDLGTTDINISGVLATGAIITKNPSKARASGGFIQQLGSQNTDVEISDSVLLYKFSGPFSSNPTRVVESGKPATVLRTYFDNQDIPEISGSLTFQTDQATALPAGWSSGTAPAPFSSGDADGIELSSVTSMGSWTNETFAACSGLAINDPVSGVIAGSGLRFYYDSSIPGWQVTSAYGLVIPSVETGTCIENGLTFTYPNPNSNPTISTSRSVRANVNSGVFMPTTTGKHVWYRIKAGTPALPSGLYLNPGTGAIIGTPAADLTTDLTLTIQGLTRQQAVYETTVTFSAGSGSSQPLTPAPAPYSGPTISTPPTETSSGKAVLRGENLDQVTGAEIDGVSCGITYADDELTIEIPDSVGNGVKDLILTGSFGRLTLQGGLILDRVVRAESSSYFWTQKQKDGSVKVYAKNVTGAGKVQFFVDGRELAWVNDVDGTDPKLRFANGASYLVRSVDLNPGKNRFEIKLDGVRVWRATYVPKS